MKLSLFSQSLFALNLPEAIRAAAELGFPAIEIACTKPHLDLQTIQRQAEQIAAQIRNAGLIVSALSLFNTFTDPTCLNEELEKAETFIRASSVFQTDLIKLTPGPPASADATKQHWQTLQSALDKLTPLAQEIGVRFAIETHMRQLTDTLNTSTCLMDMTPPDTVGLTVDFSNLAFLRRQRTHHRGVDGQRGEPQPNRNLHQGRARRQYPAA